MLAQALTLIAASLLLLQFVALDPDSCERGSKEDCHDSDFKLVRTFREGCPKMIGDVKCAHIKQKEIKEWLRKHNSFKILVTGKMGTGKTTLVKGLKENYVPDGEDNKGLPHTVKVTSYEHQHDKMDFVFYDTPGLKDTIDGLNDYSYLADMIENNEEPDLIIFTLKMDDAVSQQEDMGAIANITHAFGWKIWKNAMFVLTFANKVSKGECSAKSRANKAYYAEKKSKFSLSVTETLLENKVQEDVANSIPVIPVGLVSHVFIEAEDREISWVDEFWSNVNKVLKSSRQEEMGAQVEECCPCQKPSSSSEISCSMVIVVVVSFVAILLPLAAY